MTDRLDDAEEAIDETTTWAAEAQRVPELTAAALSLPFVIPIKLLFGVREKLFHRLAMTSIKNYHKTAGGDAIAINAKPGQQIDLEPVLWRAAEDCEAEQKPGWTAKGRDKTWNPASEGNSVNYLGRTPTILLEDDEHVEAGWLAPRIGEAIEIDNYWPLFRAERITAEINYGAGGGAVADGGHQQPGAVDFTLDTVGEWAGDNIVDLDSGEGYDGMYISTDKAREWQAEHTDSEHMQLQEERGKLMAELGSDGPNVTRLFLYAALFALGVIGLVLLGPSLVGGSLPSVGGGGGGSVNPLTIFAAALLG